MSTTKNYQTQIIRDLAVKATIYPLAEIRHRVDFIKKMIRDNGLKGVVLGISGGQDSTLAGKLIQMAINELCETGHDAKFIAIRLPYGIQKDEQHAQDALNFIAPTTVYTHNIKPSVDAQIGEHEEQGRTISDFVKGNLKARVRMTVQYDIAAMEGCIVAGTDHAAEAVTGFFTKFGDGAVDFTPLTGLTKGQGKELLKALECPEHLYNKKPTADLLDNKPGQTDEDELGLTYDLIDAFLIGKDIEEEAANKLIGMYMKTKHKRQQPYAPNDLLN